MLVIFDLDGTLFETHRVTGEGVHMACQQLNIDTPSIEDIKKLMGYPAHQFYSMLFPHLDAGTVATLRKLAGAAEFSSIATRGALYEGTKDMLTRVSSRHKLAICSNGDAEYIKEVLSSQGINNNFSIISPFEENKPKRIRLKSILDEFPNESGVMVGDRSEDFEAAQFNSIPSVGVSYGYGSRQELKSATYTINRPDDLIGILDSLKKWGLPPNLRIASPWNKPK